MNFLFLASLLIASTAHAYTESNLTLVPAGGHHQVIATPVGMYSKSDTTTPLGGSSVEAGGWSMQGLYLYGLSDSLSLGLETSYTEFETDSESGGRTFSTRIKGAGESAIRLRGNVEIGRPTLYYSLNYLFGVETKKSGDSANDGNAAPVQNGVQVEAGFVLPTDMGIKFGGIAGYTVRQDGKFSSVTKFTTTDFTVSKGDSTSFRVFAEFETALSPNVSVVRQRTYLTEFNNQTLGKSVAAGSDIWILDLNARYVFSPGFGILPRLAYSTPVEKDLGVGAKINQSDAYTLGVGLRFMF